MDNALGLVMTGGGARGAYQAGVLKRIGELTRVQDTRQSLPDHMRLLRWRSEWWWSGGRL